MGKRGGLMAALAPDLRGTVAVIGLGEAGARIAEDLARLGLAVVGYDPVASIAQEGIEQVANLAEAVSRSEYVFSLVPPAAADRVARESAGSIAPGALYVDFTSSSPQSKRDSSEVIVAAGAQFVDAGLLGVVPKGGINTPMILSGGGSERFGAFLTHLGVAAQVVSPSPGEASERKLVRSVFMKGLAAVVLETLEAGRVLGFGDWIHEEVAETLRAADESLVDRLEQGTRQHAARRVDEMTAALELLQASGLRAPMTQATVDFLTTNIEER
jgi:3-hydroxyisobutyrate dehydrogenase-like beta-hydroxyacid dehydrogenase